MQKTKSKAITLVLLAAIVFALIPMAAAVTLSNISIGSAFPTKPNWLTSTRGRLA